MEEASEVRAIPHQRFPAIYRPQRARNIYLILQGASAFRTSALPPASTAAMGLGSRLLHESVAMSRPTMKCSLCEGAWTRFVEFPSEARTPEAG